MKINDNATLSEQIGRRRPNDKVKLSVKRDGKVKQIDVTLRNKAGKTELALKILSKVEKELPNEHTYFNLVKAKIVRETVIIVTRGLGGF